MVSQGYHNSVVWEEFAHRVGCSSPSEGPDARIDKLMQDCKVRSLPVNLTHIAKKLGVVSTTYERILCDGMLVREKDGYHVILQKQAKPARQRFSYAHELSHILVHKKLPQTRSIERRSLFLQAGNYDEERLCDALAARMLMPRGLMSERYGCLSIGLDLVKQISSECSVSLGAAARRISEISNIDLCLAMFHFNSELSSVRLHRVLAPFSQSPFRVPRYADMGPVGALPTYCHSGRTVQEWAYVKERNIKRKLFIESEIAGSSRSGYHLALFGRVAFPLKSLFQN